MGVIGYYITLSHRLASPEPVPEPQHNSPNLRTPHLEPEPDVTPPSSAVRRRLQQMDGLVTRTTADEREPAPAPDGATCTTSRKNLLLDCSFPADGGQGQLPPNIPGFDERKRKALIESMQGIKKISQDYQRIQDEMADLKKNLYSETGFSELPQTLRDMHGIKNLFDENAFNRITTGGPMS